jgi:tetratricopeptide (TPR) repeat protein
MPQPRPVEGRSREFFRGAWLALVAVSLLLPLAAGQARAQPGEASVFVAQAIVAYDERRYEEAVTALREALRLDPDNVEALYYTGLVNIALGRFAEASQALERARGRDPRDQAIQFQLGALYFGLGKYDQAEPLLEQVFAANPRLDGVGYYVGFMRYRKKDYQGALRAFRAGASADPDIQQLTRFYSGLALGVLGLPERAAAEIDEALKLQPASPLTGPAERLRGAVAAAREGERRFRAEVRVGFFYDDNVPVNPDSMPGDPVVEALQQRRPRSTGELGALRLDYAFLRQGPLEATVTYSFFGTYNNNLPSFNITNHLAGLGMTYRGAMGAVPYQLALQYTYDYLTLDDEEFVQRHTVVPTLVVAPNPRHMTVLQSRLQVKDFAEDTDAPVIPVAEARDGINYLIGLAHFFRFQGDRHFIKLGYQFDLDDTDRSGGRGRNFSYVGHRVIAAAQYTLPWQGIRLRYDFDVHVRNYRHRHTLLPVAAPDTTERLDTEYTSVLGFTMPLPYNLSLAVDYQLSVNRSNLDVFTYHRNVISAVLIWSY